MLKINSSKLSELFWENAYSAVELRAPKVLNRLRDQGIEQERLRLNASIDTGSVNLAAAWSLFCTTAAARPRVVVEVGTYIGRSTKAMALAMDFNSTLNAMIFTCDASNELEIIPEGATRIAQFKRVGSTDMLRALVSEKIQTELVFLDGRISDADALLLSQLATPNTLYLLDDFEGIEKGVCNALKLAPSLSNSHFLIYPPRRSLLARFGIHDRSTIGAWLPMSFVSFARQ